ncbi:MAG: hypothetical protein QM610_06205 [Chitinophagaceae bacterium]
MYDFIIGYYLVALTVGIGAFTYTHILVGPGMLLEKVNDWAQLHLPPWLYKPIIGCEKCVAGQWALWSYIAVFDRYDWKWHMLFTLLAIFLADIVTKIYYKFFDNNTNGRKQAANVPPEVLRTLKRKTDATENH